MVNPFPSPFALRASRMATWHVEAGHLFGEAATARDADRRLACGGGKTYGDINGALMVI